jgi:PadR family transcriptional regulator
MRQRRVEFALIAAYSPLSYTGRPSGGKDSVVRVVRERVLCHSHGIGHLPVVFPNDVCHARIGNPIETMKNKTDVLQGTLALMLLKTLDVLGPLHGYGLARRIEQISGDRLTVNQGTLYPVLLKLEQEGSVASEWGTSENNRKARFYRLTRAGRRQLRAETHG